jgi:hypothetical protein
MSKFKDLTGQTFGKLKVIEMAPRITGKPIKWICQCDCGEIKEVDGSNMKQGKIKSCGCEQNASRPQEDLIGKKFGSLTVLKRFPGSENTSPKAECLCDCGRKTTVSTWHLKSGHTKTCGECTIATNHFDDLSGKKFGNVVVLNKVKIKEGCYSEQVRYSYKCLLCGNEKEAYRSAFIQGGTTSCGCFHKHSWNGKTYRSKLEVFMAIYLTKNNIDFEYEKHTFDLEIDGEITKYTPDFYIPNEDKFIEIKSEHYLDNINKFYKLSETKNIQLLKQKDLEELFGCKTRQLYRKSINDFLEVEQHFSKT